MKIGIFGGTFNPPHKGHRHILEKSIEVINFDTTLVIPNNIPSHKEMNKNAKTALERFEMCEKMFSDIAKISDIEIKKGGKSYTINTVLELLEKYPQSQLYLIIGTDSFLNIEKWVRFEEILEKCSLVVFDRFLNMDLSEHKKYIENKYKTNVFYVKTDVIEISSTIIREEGEI